MSVVDVHVADAGLRGGAAPRLAVSAAAAVLLGVRVHDARDAGSATGAVARRGTLRTCADRHGSPMFSLNSTWGETEGEIHVVSIWWSAPVITRKVQAVQMHRS